jgi:hypothetical protein
MFSDGSRMVLGCSRMVLGWFSDGSRMFLDGSRMFSDASRKVLGCSRMVPQKDPNKKHAIAKSFQNPLRNFVKSLVKIFQN